MQAGKHGYAIAVEQFEVQSTRKPPQQESPEPALCRRVGFGVTTELLLGRGDNAEKVATQAIRFLLIPTERLGDLDLRRRFENDLPLQSRRPSACAIWARLLPWPA